MLMHSFGVVQAHRTSSNHIIAELARCVEVFYMSSGWLDYTAPSLATSLQGKQGVQHIKPPRTCSNFIIAEVATSTHLAFSQFQQWSYYVRPFSSLRFSTYLRSLLGDFFPCARVSPFRRRSKLRRRTPSLYV